MNATDPASDRKDYLTSREAIAALGIRVQTLYAYVSKGLIHSVPQADTKERLYLFEDIQRVKARSNARAGHGAVAASAMDWGEPIIATSITEITAEGPRYRGQPAIRLARSESFEAVCELLWTGIAAPTASTWSATAVNRLAPSLTDAVPQPSSNSQLLEVMAIVILKQGMLRGTVEERLRSGQTLAAARQILQLMTGCFGLISRRRSFYCLPSGAHISQSLLQALDIEPTDSRREAMEAFLVLFADHELSPSTFSARVAASGGSSLHSCIASAICSSAGVHLGRMYDRVEDFLAGASTRDQLMARARKCHDQGNAIPGFGHPMYPHGDPRASLLLELAQKNAGRKSRLAAIFDFIAAVHATFGLHPRHELAAAALGMAIGLPRQSVGALFTLARTSGWVAHVQEQRMTGQLFRPRAKFVSP
jgi:citrate synthase